MMEEKKEPTFEELKKKLEECQKLKDEYLAGWQRERADFLNYKKEEIERMGEMIKYVDVGIILNFLPILDNLEISDKKLSENLKVDELRSSSPFADARVGKEDKSSSSPFAAARVNDENVKGLLQIKTQIKDFLKNQGVEEIECLGKKFDPNSQEIVGEMEVKDKEPGTVIETIQKGYTINGRLLRPAKVKVVK